MRILNQVTRENSNVIDGLTPRIMENDGTKGQIDDLPC